MTEAREETSASKSLSLIIQVSTIIKTGTASQFNFSIEGTTDRENMMQLSQCINAFIS